MFGEYLLLFGMASLGNTSFCLEWRIWEYLLLFGMHNLANTYLCSEWRICGVGTSSRHVSVFLFHFWPVVEKTTTVVHSS